MSKLSFSLDFDFVQMLLILSVKLFACLVRVFRTVWVYKKLCLIDSSLTVLLVMLDPSHILYVVPMDIEATKLIKSINLDVKRM